MNYSIKQFSSAESFQNEGVDKQMPCGKVVCNLCLKENYEEDSKHEEIVYKNLNRRSQLSVKKKLSLLSKNYGKITNELNKKIEEVREYLKEQGTKSAIFTQDNNKNILINPCNCETLVHTNCILKWCVLNMSFQCSTCGKYINNIDFEEEPLETIDKLKLIFKVVFFILSTIFSILTAIILFTSLKVLEDVFSYWQKIFGIVTLLFAFSFLYYTIESIKDCLRKRFSIIKFSNIFHDSHSEMTDEVKNKTIINFLRLYERRYQVPIEQLIEEKHNNILFKNSINLEIDKLRRCFTILAQGSLDHGVKINNFIFGISVDSLSHDHPLKKQTSSSPSNYMTKKNAIFFRNPIGSYENSPVKKLNKKKKKFRENDFVKRRRSFQINFVINNNRRTNEVEYNLNQSNVVSEQNELINIEKISLDNELKEKENV
jgi:hypothetical protein